MKNTPCEWWAFGYFSQEAVSPWKESTVSEGTWTFLSGQIFQSNAWNASPILLPMSTSEDLEKLVRLLENPWYAMMSLKLGGIETWSPPLLLWEDMVWMVSMLWYAVVWYRYRMQKTFHSTIQLGVLQDSTFNINVNPRFFKKSVQFFDYETDSLKSQVCESWDIKVVISRSPVIKKLVSKHLWWKTGSVCLGKLFFFWMTTWFSLFTLSH